MSEIQENQTSEDAVAVFEKFIGAGLPKFYRQNLLKKMKDVRSGPYKSKCKENESVIHHPYYLNPKDDYDDLVRIFLNFREDIPDTHLPIADDVFGNQILLCLKGPHRGKVYFWDHEVAPDGGWEEGVTLIADSFEEFVNSIEPDSEE